MIVSEMIHPSLEKDYQPTYQIERTNFVQHPCGPHIHPETPNFKKNPTLEKDIGTTYSGATSDIYRNSYSLYDRRKCLLEMTPKPGIDCILRVEVDIK